MLVHPSVLIFMREDSPLGFVVRHLHMDRGCRDRNWLRSGSWRGFIFVPWIHEEFVVPSHPRWRILDFSSLLVLWALGPLLIVLSSLHPSTRLLVILVVFTFFVFQK